MAEDTRTIRIEIANINVDGSGTRKSPKTKTPEELQDAQDRAYQQDFRQSLYEMMHPIKSSQGVSNAEKSVRGQAIAGLAQQTIQTIEGVLDYSINRHLNLTENYLAQNDYNRIKSVYGIAKGAASSIIQGATAGAAFGPVGAIAGAAIGAASFGVQTAMQQSERYSQYYQQLNATNFNTQYNQKRAGLYDGSRGTES